MDRFVIFNKATGKRYGMEHGSYKEWKTESAAKAALTRLQKKHLKNFLDRCHDFMDRHDEICDEAKYSTEEQRRTYISREMNHSPDWELFEGLCDSVIVTYDYFYENEPMVMRTNKMSGKKFIERMNTPYFLSPSSDNYWAN